MVKIVSKNNEFWRILAPTRARKSSFRLFQFILLSLTILTQTFCTQDHYVGITTYVCIWKQNPKICNFFSQRWKSLSPDVPIRLFFPGGRANPPAQINGWGCLFQFERGLSQSWYHLVSLYQLTILTSQGHISELLVISQVSREEETQWMSLLSCPLKETWQITSKDSQGSKAWLRPFITWMGHW